MQEEAQQQGLGISQFAYTKDITKPNRFTSCVTDDWDKVAAFI